MRRGRWASHLVLRECTCAVCIVAAAAKHVAAQLQIPTSSRIGPYGEMTSKPWFDPGAGLRALISVASVGEFRLDVGVRRPESTDSGGTLVGTLAGTVQYNAWGGYPYRQIGLFTGYQFFRGSEHGGEILVGVSMASSHARGEHVQYELSLGPRFTRGRQAEPVLRFKMIVLRLPPLLGRVRSPSPLDLRKDSVDAGGVLSNPRWMGASRQNVDRMCRFSYVQTSEIPLLIYRPECTSTDHPTLNQPISPFTAKHGGLSCGVKDAEPIIRGHINWFVVNQTGRLRWQGYSGGIQDHDFDLFMEAPDLVTAGNVSANNTQKELRDDPNREGLIEIEFNGEETAGLFSTEQGGELWSPLIALRRLSVKSSAYDSQNVLANSLFRDRPAVVTGLLGLDGEHDFHTELHPVLAFAVDVSHEMRDRYTHAWLVLIRNMGNEGECSSGQLPWVSRDSTRYVLEIPWKTGADSVVVDTDSSHFGYIARRVVTLKVEVDQARAVRLVADLPQPTRTDSAAIVYGTLGLRWFGHGRPLANDSGAVRPAGVSPPRHPDERGFEPVNLVGFPLTRRLCFTLASAESVNRDPPPFFPPTTVLRDVATPAPSVLDEGSCSAPGPATKP